MSKRIILIDYPRRGWCHLVGDTISNLHDFAKEIGVNKCWFENKRGKNRPHYDVRDSMVNKVIENGATQVKSSDVVIFLKKHYEN